MKEYETLNSLYQVRSENGGRVLVRRVVGAFAPTENLGTDGEWQEAKAVTVARAARTAQVLVIEWLDKKPTHTVTSRIVETRDIA